LFEQVKHITQAVSADEYDEAVSNNPMVSVLSATGDLRTGRQLLADAAADRLRTIAWMAACPHGRMELDVMADSAKCLFGRLP
jgi:acyl-CoA reductase-like NAD-dependent aldehyde dehydrogenase